MDALAQTYIPAVLVDLYHPRWYRFDLPLASLRDFSLRFGAGS